jgi:hypothetical protein
MIIAITGLIGSGKDTAAKFLVDQYNFKQMSFAESLKDAISAIFGWDRNLLEGSTEESRIWREQVDEWWANRLNMPNLTPRWILQYWGTEVCRLNFHNEIWIASLENKLRMNKENIVISDSRFANELNAVKATGGITVRVSRGPDPSWYESAIIYNKGRETLGWNIAKYQLEVAGIHASEFSSVGLDYDYYIRNDGTLEELYDKVKLLINP